ncbi:hypothetical protein MLD38_026244 [Melastoma candidum]|uniref:Uncharacterized protein n=1 Tax=Melastoma candidum TaxID=119954 RepID=A0ACB9NZT3_9MYRT|nr:hypothetical protein MLD38_026244 [Melastoma candidum]
MAAVEDTGASNPSRMRSGTFSSGNATVGEQVQPWEGTPRADLELGLPGCLRAGRGGLGSTLGCCCRGVARPGKGDAGEAVARHDQTRGRSGRGGPATVGSGGCRREWAWPALWASTRGSLEAPPDQRGNAAVVGVPGEMIRWVAGRRKRGSRS